MRLQFNNDNLIIGDRRTNVLINTCLWESKSTMYTRSIWCLYRTRRNVAGKHIPESHRFQPYINYAYTYSHRHCLTPWKLRRLFNSGWEFLTSLDQTEIASFRAVLDSYAPNCLHRTNQLR